MPLGVMPVVKRAARRTLPGPLLRLLLNARARLMTRRARRVFERAPREPAYLGRAELERLFGEFPPVRDYLYDKGGSRGASTGRSAISRGSRSSSGIRHA